jgi:hypothetical protein
MQGSCCAACSAADTAFQKPVLTGSFLTCGFPQSRARSDHGTVQCCAFACCCVRHGFAAVVFISAYRLPLLVCQIAFPQISGQGALRGVIARRAGRHDGDAVDRAGRQAQATTRAFRGNHRMHQLARADDGIDRTGGQAQCAADAGGFINDGRCWCSGNTVCCAQRHDRYVQQCRQFGNDCVAARRTLIDRGRARGDGVGIGPAAGVITLAALSLRQQRIDGIGTYQDQAAGFAQALMQAPTSAGPAYTRPV